MESSAQRFYPSQHHLGDSLEDSTAHSRTRHPLADATGNVQNQEALVLSSLSHHDSKATQPGDRPQYVLPSQPSQQTLGNTLEFRKQSIRRQRRSRLGSLNPIINSPQYIAYRNRQAREGNENDLKWPALLEDAFLDALQLIPKMGRRKYSMRGKPYGRNELISEYLWISYKQSLPPGAVPDETMRRARKQVSSHIQVLKGFMKGHPAAERLFSKTVPQNGFEDSFKNDPVLNALQHGRIWNPHSATDHSEHANRLAVQSHMSTKPIVFWLLITKSQVPDDASGRYTSEQDLYRDRAVVHKYTGLQPHPRSREYLGNIPNWRERFPYLARAGLNCEIIHMDVSLELMKEYAPPKAELVTRMEMTIPGHELRGHQWQTVTSLFKPQELHYEDPAHDPPLDRRPFIAETLEVNDSGTRIKVPFPANTWAHALTCLTNLQHESRKVQLLERASSHSTSTVRESIEQISMYQEVQSTKRCSDCAQRRAIGMNPGLQSSTSRCSCGKGEFMTSAIILWTFHKARHGETGSTTWRYIDAIPPRRTVMSPSPHPTHHIQASMSEHFNSWAETPLYLQHQNMLDPFSQVQGLATPPPTAGLQSPFVPGYGHHGQHSFDAHQENISFISYGTVDSESTLVDNETTANLDSFLSNSNVNVNLDFDTHVNPWHMPHTQSFDADQAWATYNVPASTPQLGWENEKSHWPEVSPTKQNHAWPEASPTKQVSWTEDVDGKPEHEQIWHDVLPSVAKQDQSFIGTGIEGKSLPWAEHPDGEAGAEENAGSYAEGNIHEGTDQLPHLGNGNIGDLTSGTNAKDWNGGDESFSYDPIDDRMK